ncbi:hypothetical protein [Streptomyces salinarius]|uniref:hypothetical protein n=1 Tax=Streptomyces salinarius TaxID=2762598 RepID=UPI001647F1A7|nr:hypothetical protein [Streptomyces salinarius]
MENIAFLFSDLTTPDRADRARAAWELYHRAHAGQIKDLIADLMHLADVDDLPGGGVYAARRGAADYTAELPAWLPETPVRRGAYLAQTRPAGQTWVTVDDGDDQDAVAEKLLSGMHRVGFRIADLPGYIADLAAGHILTSEQGHEFRVIANPAVSG